MKTHNAHKLEQCKQQ